MSESFPLPTKPGDFIPSLVKRFNSKNLEAMLELYAPEAGFVAHDGRPITDRNELGALFQHDMNFGAPLKANVRHVFVRDDTAQIVLDWSIDGTGFDGKPDAYSWYCERHHSPRRGWRLEVHHRQ